MPLLSICVPTYKKADWVKASLLNTLSQVQAMEPGLVEVVVSDDASTDHSPQVLKELQLQYSQFLRVYYQDKNLGNNANYVFTLSQAQGQFVWLVGNDDFLRPGAVKKVLSAIQANPHLDYFYMSYAFFKPPATVEEMPTLDQIAMHERDLPACLTGKHDRGDRRLKWLGEIPALDFLCFTPMYSGIAKKQMWIDAYSFNAAGDFFRDLEGSFGYAQYLVEHFLNIPGYYIGHPYVLASTDITWLPFAPSATLKGMPRLYDLLEEKGVSSKVIRAIKAHFLKKLGPSIYYVLTQPQILHNREFSWVDHTRRYWTFWQYWLNMAYVGWRLANIKESQGFWVPFLKKYLPKQAYDWAKKMKNSAKVE